MDIVSTLIRLPIIRNCFSFNSYIEPQKRYYFSCNKFLNYLYCTKPRQRNETDIFIGKDCYGIDWYLSENIQFGLGIPPKYWNKWIDFPFIDKIEINSNLIYYIDLSEKEIMYLKLMS